MVTTGNLAPWGGFWHRHLILRSDLWQLGIHRGHGGIAQVEGGLSTNQGRHTLWDVPILRPFPGIQYSRNRIHLITVYTHIQSVLKPLCLWTSGWEGLGLQHTIIWPWDQCFPILSIAITHSLIVMQKDLTVSCMGVALQTVIPKMIHKKITAFFELIKPLVEFKVNHVVLFVLIPVLTFWHIRHILIKSTDIIHNKNWHLKQQRLLSWFHFSTR